MKVSIIIPTRNRSSLLKESLKRVVSQLKLGDEIIVVDNASNDDTKNVIKDYMQIYSSITYLYEQQRGPSYARNLGISHAKGNICAFLDDDCFVSSKWLQSIKKCFTNNSEKKIYQGKIDHIFPEENFLTQIFYQKNKFVWQDVKINQQWKKGKYIDFIHAGNFCIRAIFLKKLSYVFDEKLFPFIGEEKDLAIRMQLYGFKIQYNEDIEVRHMKSKTNIFYSLKSKFLYGRALGILQEKYVAKSKILSLFKNELKIEKQNMYYSNNMPLLWKKAKFKSYQLPIIVIYLLISDLIFDLGKIYGSLKFRISN